MDIFFLEQDVKLQDAVVDSLNACRLKMNIKKVQNEQELFDDTINISTYKLFILNLKDPIDPRTINFIRKKGSVAPILLVLEKDVNPKLFKTMYYLSYNHIIVKDFVPEEIVYSIYKLCGVWNNDIFFLDNCVYFDFRNEVFVNKEEMILFGKKEALLLKYLLLKSPSLISCDEIVSLVYENEVISQERIRSLVKQVRSKLPVDIITTVKGQGYQILPSAGKSIKRLSQRRISPKVKS